MRDVYKRQLKNSAPVNGEAIRASAGALSNIPVCRVGSIRTTLLTLKGEGFQVVAATEKSRKLLYDADLRRPTAIVMGAEDKGISREVLKLCDEQLAIPPVSYTHLDVYKRQPEAFIRWSNVRFGSGDGQKRPARVIVETDGPVDAFAREYLASKGYETEGAPPQSDKAALLLRLAASGAGAVGLLLSLIHI